MICVSLSIICGLVVIAFMFKKVVKINRKYSNFINLSLIKFQITEFFKMNLRITVGRPSFFTMIASLMSTGLYIISSVIMIIITFVRYDEYSASCTVLVALEQFFLLAYFFWLLITVLMNYFTVKFELKNFDRWFKPLSVMSFGKYLFNKQQTTLVTFSKNNDNSF